MLWVAGETLNELLFSFTLKLKFFTYKFDQIPISHANLLKGTYMYVTPEFAANDFQSFELYDSI